MIHESHDGQFIEQYDRVFFGGGWDKQESMLCSYASDASPRHDLFWGLPKAIPKGRFMAFGFPHFKTSSGGFSK